MGDHISSALPKELIAIMSKEHREEQKNKEQKGKGKVSIAKDLKKTSVMINTNGDEIDRTSIFKRKLPKAI